MNLVACQPHIEHGNILPMWLQEVVQHQWDPMVEILSPPEMVYGQWSYGESCCIYVEHR
jgi:hypothetical protein